MKTDTITTCEGNIVEFRYPLFSELSAFTAAENRGEQEVALEIVMSVTDTDGNEIPKERLSLYEAHEVWQAMWGCLRGGGNG